MAVTREIALFNSLPKNVNKINNYNTIAKQCKSLHINGISDAVREFLHLSPCA